MTYGLWIHGLANGTVMDGMPCWLSEIDWNAHAPGKPYPTGAADGSSDPADAITFETKAEAMTFWKRVSPEVPTRPDGKPNRPLAAFTIEVKELS